MPGENIPQLIVFDLGGTLIHDRGEVAGAFAAALRTAGYTLEPQQLAQVRGASKREAIRALLAQHSQAGPREIDAAAETVYAAFLVRLRESYTHGVGALPGAQDALAWLKRRGIRLALNTGFERSIVDLILDRLPWLGEAAGPAICGDDVPQGRPAPYMIFNAMQACGVHSVRQVAVVGDTTLDLRAGWNAGAGWNIGVLSGAHSRARLEQAPHTHLLPSVASLPELFASAA